MQARYVTLREGYKVPSADSQSKGSYARECGLLNSYAVRGAVLVHTALVTSIVSGLLLRMPKEDDALKKTFGAQWDEWARRVPYKLIPGIC